MLIFDRGDQRFCYRVAAVIVDRGRVLLQAVEEGPTFEAPFYCLPGGRVEHGETAEECVAREMREELEDEVRVERLLWVMESFFEHEGMSWHEIGMYFLVSLPEDSRLLSGEGPHWGVEPEIGIKFRLEWHDVEKLDGVRLLPSFLRERLRSLPDDIEYVVHRGE
ncbi:MAG TPA: NUDIX domain-containing protein [Dehalococcoidia bacterium]|jgi:ADP-ribose pyrophosphatase YjhB (NUDIX family)|nr:NUDIX domain-containing protein [Dehalococcoidia bacterium]